MNVHLLMMLTSIHCLVASCAYFIDLFKRTKIQTQVERLKNKNIAKYCKNGKVKQN